MAHAHIIYRGIQTSTIPSEILNKSNPAFAAFQFLRDADRLTVQAIDSITVFDDEGTEIDRKEFARF